MKKENKYKEELLKISPQNQMDPKKIEQFKKGMEQSMSESNKPVIEMEEGKTMPLFMLIGQNRMFETAVINIMASIIHHIKTDKLEIRGRIRFDATGNKTMFRINKEFDLKELEDAKAEVRSFYKLAVEDLKLEELEPVFELEFDVNESMDSIMKKINDSDKFSIGTVEKNK